MFLSSSFSSRSVSVPVSSSIDLLPVSLFTTSVKLSFSLFREVSRLYASSDIEMFLRPILVSPCVF